jgi:transcriptional regulator of aroF, aroG, tyrA and aromatic amino acid transport
MYQKGKDLYYRLNAFPLRIAPLRERKEDILFLATHFTEASVEKLGWPKTRLTRAGIEVLQNYDWPATSASCRT